jgi:hypothetical protein
MNKKKGIVMKNNLRFLLFTVALAPAFFTAADDKEEGMAGMMDQESGRGTKMYHRRMESMSGMMGEGSGREARMMRLKGKMQHRMGLKSKMMGKHIGEFLVAVQDKSVTLPPELIQKLMNLKAKKYELAAQEVEKTSEQLRNPEEKAAYKKFAAQLRDLARSIKQLPVPAEGIKKSFEMMPEWMKLKAHKKALIAHMLSLLAQRTGDRRIKRAAMFMKHHAQALRKAVDYVQSMEQETDEEQATSEY